MGMATIAILSLNTTFKDIQSAISSKYGKTKFDDLDADIDYGGTDSKGKYSLYFKDRKENRRMYIALENSCKEDNNIEGVYCSLTYSKNSIEIAKYLCETFGGHLLENDVANEFQYIKKLS